MENVYITEYSNFSGYTTHQILSESAEFYRRYDNSAHSFLTHSVEAKLKFYNVIDSVLPDLIRPLTQPLYNSGRE